MMASKSPALAAFFEQCFENARHSKLYQGLYVGINDWQRAPFISKKELIPLLDQHFDIHSEREGVYLVRSGGSTQKPLIFPVDIRENHEQRQALSEALHAAQIFNTGSIALNIFGYSDLYRTAAIMDDLLERCNATTLPLSAHARFDAICDAADFFKPDLLLGTPSKLFHLSDYLKKNQRKLAIPNLLFGGEPLRASMLDQLRDVFQFKHTYALYGSAETGIWAWSSFPDQRSLYRIIPGILLEIVEPDEQGFGAIAVSNLYRKRLPVFRYLIGDMGRIITENGVAYLELKGREPGSFTYWEQHFDINAFAPLYQDAVAWQFQLSKGDGLVEKLDLLLVTDTPLASDDLKKRSESLRNQVFFNPKWMEVTVLQVDAPQLYIDPHTGKSPALIDWR